MRARNSLRAIRATRTGTLSLTVAIAAIGLGTVSAGAFAAQSGAKPATASAATRRPSRLSHLRFAAVPSRLVVDRNLLATPAGGTVVVHGLLQPRRGGAEVKLMTRNRHRWQTLAVSRTLRNGRFGIRYRVHGEGASWVRVRFPGSRRARATSAAAGKIVALAPAVASWYYDAGNTACGFHATYGVANKTLPCGTKVTLSYGGRTVIATVDDRGPYVYGRTFDLNQNTARYLGMSGVGTVFAST